MFLFSVPQRWPSFVVALSPCVFVSLRLCATPATTHPPSLSQDVVVPVSAGTKLCVQGFDGICSWLVTLHDYSKYEPNLITGGMVGAAIGALFGGCIYYFHYVHFVYTYTSYRDVQLIIVPQSAKKFYVPLNDIML